MEERGLGIAPRQGGFPGCPPRKAPFYSESASSERPARRSGPIPRKSPSLQNLSAKIFRRQLIWPGQPFEHAQRSFALPCGVPLQWDVFRGVKEPRLRLPVPSGQQLDRGTIRVEIPI